MLKKGILVVVAIALVGLGSAYLWANAVLSGDTVRGALAAQIAKAVGQPVAIGKLSASVFPRVSVNLGNVAIGEPARLRLAELKIATSLGALLSRRIEHATVRLDGARIDLPLPPLGAEAPASGEPAAGPGLIQLVSIDEIVLHDVQIVSGGRTLRGEVELVPQGAGFALQNTQLQADGTKIAATGAITDVGAPAGEIDLKATALDIDQLVAFATAFSSGAGTKTPRGESRRSGPSTMDITLSLAADRASLGTLALDRLSGRARVTAQAITLNPIGFGLFGGRYDGSLTLAPERDEVAFRTAAKLSDVDVAAAAMWAGHPDTISGRMSGRLELAGRGADAAAVTSSARGSGRIDVINGVIRNLGLINAVVVATSMRSGATGRLGSGSKDEPFSRLGATLRIADGALTTDDLRLESNDLFLDARGALQLRAATIDLKGRVQLSDALSKQAGSDLVRYTQEQGRVTLPATITGPVSSPSIRIDVADLAKRAITNAAQEELNKRLKEGGIKKGLSDLFKR